MCIAGLTTHHVCISGFLQNEGQTTGIARVWRELRRYNSPEVDVQLRAWNANWRAFAERIYLHSIASPVVRIYAYSWGAGHGAMQLARHLQRREIAVESMVLSDPVFRSASILGRWMAIWPWSRIVVPANVRRVRWFRQFHDWPRGHQLAAESPGTEIVPPEGHLAPPGVGHCEMDELRAFQQLCLVMAQHEVRPC